MRNVMIMSDNGIETPYELDYTINPKCKKFNKMIFKEKGIVECFPFLNLIKEFYINTDPKSPILEKLNNIRDEFDIWIIFNRIIDDPKPWQINKFLSNIFNTDIYAENICIFVSQEELNNGKIEVSQNEYYRFSSKVFEISKISLQKITNDYLSSLDIFINEDVVSLSGNDVINFQDEYFGKKQSTNFTELIELNNNDIILRKNGVILIIENDNAELYFCQPNSDNEIFKEILC